MQHLKDKCPALTDNQVRSLQQRAMNSKYRLYKWEGARYRDSGSVVPALTTWKFHEFGLACLEAEKQFAVGMTSHYACCGCPGINVCMNAQRRAELTWYEHWQLIDYDHGPNAEMQELSNAVAQFLAKSPEASLTELNQPLLMHLLYGLDWVQLKAGNGDTILVCPNVAPRCSATQAKRAASRVQNRDHRFTSPGVVTAEDSGCHDHRGHGWATHIVERRLIAGIAYEPLQPWIPFSLEVLP